MRIRVLESDDAEAFRKIRLQGLQTDPTAFSSSYTEEVERPLDVIAKRLGAEGNYVFGAFSEIGQLVGVIGLHREQRTKSHHKAFIWGMYVAPEFREQGIGHSLLTTAISKARKLPGTRQINLTVITSNQAAHSLYESCGFETFGLERRAIEVNGIYYDVAYMTLHLDPKVLDCPTN
jgi:RimJ/RimL family protein N-acetyltransferase